MAVLRMDTLLSPSPSRLSQIPLSFLIWVQCDLAFLSGVKNLSCKIIESLNKNWFSEHTRCSESCRNGHRPKMRSGHGVWVSIQAWTFFVFQTMGGDFSGKNQDCSKGIYALAGMCRTSDHVCALRRWCLAPNSPSFWSSGCFPYAEEAQLQEAGPSGVCHFLRDLQWKGKSNK